MRSAAHVKLALKFQKAVLWPLHALPVAGRERLGGKCKTDKQR